MTEPALSSSPVSPAPLNYGTGITRETGPLTRFFLSPIGWPTFALTALAALLSLVGATAFPYYVGIALGSFACWSFVAVVLVGRAFIRVMIGGAEYRWSEIRSGWFRWLVPPVVFAVVYVLIAAEVPLRVAFRISKPSMNRLAAQVLASPNVSHADRWVGVYGAHGIEPLPLGGSGMRFRVAGTGFMFRGGGFAYSPSGAPRTSMSGVTDTYKPLGGGWYTWEWEW